ncbi:MAG: cytochrome c [Planctomycetes bacterium]|nr:cytochrome c [Planctomycetota bacterium]
MQRTRPTLRPGAGSGSSSLRRLAAVLALSLAGCMRGGTSELPPVHVVLDMDFQPKLKAQAASGFPGWPDGRGMRLPVADSNGRPAVVARGTLPDPVLANRGADDQFVNRNPVPPTAAVLQRGREQFDVHCAICHGYSGQGGNDPQTGHGMTGRRWPVKIPSFHFATGEGADNRVPNLLDGELFEVIANGKGTMPAYGARIVPADRWAIVHYVRALQRLSK